jgi:hypothetical protein
VINESILDLRIVSSKLLESFFALILPIYFYLGLYSLVEKRISTTKIVNFQWNIPKITVLGCRCAFRWSEIFLAENYGYVYIHFIALFLVFYLTYWNIFDRQRTNEFLTRVSVGRYGRLPHQHPHPHSHDQNRLFKSSDNFEIKRSYYDGFFRPNVFAVRFRNQIIK